MIVSKIWFWIMSGFETDFLIKTIWLLSIVQWLSMLIWSICFGWLYVKFTNWLNHFPVLGKKVF